MPLSGAKLSGPSSCTELPQPCRGPQLLSPTKWRYTNRQTLGKEATHLLGLVGCYHCLQPLIGAHAGAGTGGGRGPGLRMWVAATRQSWEARMRNGGMATRTYAAALEQPFCSARSCCTPRHPAHLQLLRQLARPTQQHQQVTVFQCAPAAAASSLPQPPHHHQQPESLCAPAAAASACPPSPTPTSPPSSCQTGSGTACGERNNAG